MAAQRLQGRVALVTGASRGIGACIAARLALEGAVVIVNYLLSDAAAALVVGRIERAGGRASAVQADVTDPASVRALFETCMSCHGRLDILVNNAGRAVAGRILETSPQVLAEAMSVNVVGPLLCAQQAARLMVPNGRGRIVNVSSIGGLGTAVAGVAPYAVAKAALNMLTKRLAYELGTHGITVNAICPGLIETDMLHATRDEADFAAMRADPASRALLGRTGQPADIAGVAAFLASDDAAFMTGQVLAVDGGRIDYLTRSG